MFERIDCKLFDYCLIVIGEWFIVPSNKSVQTLKFKKV